MGRGRGRGRKLTVVSHDNQESSGEEVIPTYKRRGRPHKLVKNDSIEDDTSKTEGGEDDVKLATPNKELTGSNMESSPKRKRDSQFKEKADSDEVETNAAETSSNEESVKFNGFRHIGSRRKNKPHRAAEAGFVCN